MSFARRNSTDPLFSFGNGRRCDVELQTESRENFMPPRRQKQVVTREAKFEEFLWRECYDEYIRTMQSRIGAERRPNTSEYFEQFSNVNIREDKSEIEELIRKYPVYGSTAISHWNPELSKPKTFKCSRSFSKPIGEQLDIQFG